MIIRENNNTVRLCCNRKGCPTVEDLGDGNVKITDDNGMFIVVKKEEAKLIVDGVKVLDGDNEQLLLG